MSDYKYIRIDMDYCATPVWVSKDIEGVFINGDFENIPNIPITLKHALSCYQNLWEDVHSGKYWNCFDLDTEESDWEMPEMKVMTYTLEMLAHKLATEVKKYHPEKRVFIWCNNDNYEIL